MSETNLVFRAIFSYFPILPDQQVGAQWMVAPFGVTAHLFGDGFYVSRVMVAKGNKELAIGEAD